MQFAIRKNTSRKQGPSNISQWGHFSSSIDWGDAAAFDETSSVTSLQFGNSSPPKKISGFFFCLEGMWHSLIIGMEVMISTLPILLAWQGCISWYIPGMDWWWENGRTLPRIGINWVVHPLRPRDFPRHSRCPSGFALGTFLGPREISWSLGMYNPIHPSSQQCTDLSIIFF